jgi:hypothetical protein
VQHLRPTALFLNHALFLVDCCVHLFKADIVEQVATRRQWSNHAAKNGARNRREDSRRKSVKRAQGRRDKNVNFPGRHDKSIACSRANEREFAAYNER